MKVRADEARQTKGMNPTFKHVVLAGAATLALAACASPEAQNAAPSPLWSPPTASSTMHHVFQSRELGSSSLIQRVIFTATINNKRRDLALEI